MIIDCHGHYTTAPAPLKAFRERQLNAFKSGSEFDATLHISDDEIRQSLENSQLKMQRERGADLTLFRDAAREIKAILDAEGVGHMPLGVDVIEPPMLFELQKAGIEVLLNTRVEKTVVENMLAWCRLARDVARKDLLLFRADLRGAFLAFLIPVALALSSSSVMAVSRLEKGRVG